MDSLKPATTSSGQIPTDRGSPRVAMIDSGRLGVFSWPSVNCSYGEISSYGEIRCFKFKRSRQLWGVFVASSNNDAKVLFKLTTKFQGNSTYKVSLKKTLGE